MFCVFKVRGLCGTLTWSQLDDFTTPEGDVEISVSSFAEKFISQSCTLPKAAPSDPCSTYTQRLSYAERVCSVIHSPVFQVSVFIKRVHFVWPHSLLDQMFTLSSRRSVTTWWRRSPIYVCVCQKCVPVLCRGPVTALYSLLIASTVPRRGFKSPGEIRLSAVSENRLDRKIFLKYKVSGQQKVQEEKKQLVCGWEKCSLHCQLCLLGKLWQKVGKMAMPESIVQTTTVGPFCEWDLKEQS